MSSTTHHNFKVSAADWNKTSSNYAANISKAPMSIPIFHLISLLDTHLPFSSATTILDVGCGPGNGTAAIISTFHDTLPPGSQILSTDFSEGMVDIVARTRRAKLEELSEESKEREIWEKVQPLVMDATDLSPLPDASVSHIIANFVFFMTESPEKALTEALRVLQPQGICACSSWARCQWMELLDLAAQRSFPGFGKPVHEMPVIAPQWTNAEGIATLLDNAGFRDVQTEYVEAPIVAQDPEGFAKFFLGSGNPAVTWITDVLSEEEIREVEKAFEEMIREVCERNEEGGYVLAGTAVLAAGKVLH
ncbi:S-adenosyl-L-methionine-dependent methyltransferase [Aureobasidium namibiae CBS 147.97]|uniref:S-adenosyl-L-methionine-dependent methyltransferase n=1 Tax=Aureobasidium namibiae CBS 147.97 TaxID=1043004 RepID=A0A074WG80_9PEZI